MRTNILTRRIGLKRLGLLVAGMLVLPLTIFTGTANAAMSSCPTNSLCAWSDANYGGIQWSWGGDWHGTCLNVTTAQNDKFSSFYNRLPVNVTFYKNSNCGNVPAGDQVWAVSGAHSYVADGTGQFPWAMNDQISSIWFSN